MPAPAATQTTKPTAIASRKRPPPTLVCVTGPGSGGDEQRHEHGEPDELAEREVDDAGEPVDEREPGGEQPVDAARGEPRDEDLESEAHARTLFARYLPSCGGSCTGRAFRRQTQRNTIERRPSSREGEFAWWQPVDR